MKKLNKNTRHFASVEAYVLDKCSARCNNLCTQYKCEIACNGTVQPSVHRQYMNTADADGMYMVQYG